MLKDEASSFFIGHSHFIILELFDISEVIGWEDDIKDILEAIGRRLDPIFLQKLKLVLLILFLSKLLQLYGDILLFRDFYDLFDKVALTLKNCIGVHQIFIFFVFI